MSLNKNYLLKRLSYIPLGKLILKFGYQRAIRQLDHILEDHQDVLVDIFLISNIQSRDFIYGISDLNIFFVVKDDSHPKKILRELRIVISKLSPLNIFINHNILPIFTQSEFKSSKVRSLLATKEDRKKVFWKSIKEKEIVQYEIGSQGLFSSQHFLLDRFDKTFARIKEINPTRSFLRLFGKNVNQLITQFMRNGLLRRIEDPTWEKLGSKLYGFNIFAIFYFRAFRRRSWELLDQETVSYSSSHQNFDQYPEKLIKLTRLLLLNEYIEDIIYTPALLQFDPNEIRGKVYVDVILKTKNRSLKDSQLKKMRKSIIAYMDENKVDKTSPRVFFQFSTMSLIKIKYEKALFTFPLENLFRIQKSFSARGRSYSFKASQKSIERACIHFLLIQFMRFRSEHLKSGLIGSKFIKSLNLIIKYQMIYEYLETKKMDIPTNFNQMRERITPQMGYLRPDDTVTDDDWNIISLQLLYYLKNIRLRLSEKNPELKSLIF